MFLGLSALNFGTKLETSVSQYFAFRKIARLDNLDMKILGVTILVSLLFLIKAVVDILMAWDLL